MIYQNYRTIDVQHRYRDYTIRHDFSHLTLNEIDREIEHTIEQMSMYRSQGILSDCIVRGIAELIDFTHRVSDIIRPIEYIPYSALAKSNPLAFGLDPWRAFNQLERKLDMLKSRRRDLINR